MCLPHLATLRKDILIIKRLVRNAVCSVVMRLLDIDDVDYERLFNLIESGSFIADKRRISVRSKSLALS